MRVLHVYRTYFPDTQGGLEEAIRQICRATGSGEVHNTIFTLSSDPLPARISTPEAEVIRARKAFEVASCGFAVPSGVATFAKLASRHDVIHYHHPWPFADMLHVGLLVRRPGIVTYHSDVVRQRLLASIYGPLMRRFLGAVHAVVATSPQYARTSPVLTALAHKVSVVPLTIDPASYPGVDLQTVATWRRRLGEPYFLFVGVLRYYKGLDYLLEAAQQVPYRIVIAGHGPEGRRLQRIASERRLQNVSFLGQISDTDKVALIEGARAVMLPSHLRAEAFGVTLLEGAMRAKPLISCEIGTGTSHVNVNGRTGIVVPPANPDALAAAMRTLAGDDELAHRLGRASQERFQAVFASATVGAHYTELYRRAVAAA